jgi:hypothetical protein
VPVEDPVKTMFPRLFMATNCGEDPAYTMSYTLRTCVSDFANRTILDYTYSEAPGAAWR